MLNIELGSSTNSQKFEIFKILKSLFWSHFILQLLDNKNFEKSYDWSLQSQQLAKEIAIRLFIESSFANMFLLLIEVEKTNAILLKEKIYAFFNASSFKDALKIVEEQLSAFKKYDQNLKLLKGSSEGYKIIGDVDYNSVIDKVSFITPVPGGVGPMTIAMLVENTIEAAEKYIP